MDNNIFTMLGELQSAKDKLQVIPECFWFKIDRNNRVEVKRGEAFNKKFSKMNARLDSIINDLDSFVKKNFATKTRTEMVKFKTALSAIEFVYDDDTKKIVWESIMGKNIPIPSREEIDTIKFKLPKERKLKGSTERNIESFDNFIPHSLDEDFSGKVPCSFSIGDNFEVQENSWSNIYVRTCRFLLNLDKNKFETLWDAAVADKIGIRLISKNDIIYHRAAKISDEIYVDIKLTATAICGRIKKLLDFFEIPRSEMKIYLNKNRKA